jgi:hypothetical protein
MARSIKTDFQDLWNIARYGPAMEAAQLEAGPSSATYSAGVYGRYGEVTVSGGAGPDTLNASFWGDNGDTFSGITGGAAGGNLNNGYTGSFSNNYGGTIWFSGIETFNLSTGIYGDNVKVGDGDDTVNTGDGADTIDSGRGVDVVDGGASSYGGYDRWVADKGFATDAIVIDITSAAAQTYLGTGSVSGIESLFLKTGSGNDVITGYVAAGNSNQISTGAGDDRIGLGIYGRYGADTVAGGLGSDTLVATFTGDGGDGGGTFSNINGGVTAGNFAKGYNGKFDNSYGGTLVFSGIEHFNVTSGSSPDNFKTGDGNDTVASNGGDDTFDTGKGIDIVDGGLGNDRWIADKSFASRTSTSTSPRRDRRATSARARSTAWSLSFLRPVPGTTRSPGTSRA